MSGNKYKILVVEDEENIRNLVATLLETAGYQTILADSCSVARMLYTSYLPDLVLLDLGLPDADGMRLLAFVRERAWTPVIVLSARTNETDKVAALDRGANDYVTKPFGAAELLARVRTALRNGRGHPTERQPRERFVLRELAIDYAARRVYFKDEEVHLTQTEYNIVALLSENCGKMMTYSAITQAVWGESADSGNIKKLQVNMANIRRKLGAQPGEAHCIANELGVGYRMNG